MESATTRRRIGASSGPAVLRWLEQRPPLFALVACVLATVAAGGAWMASGGPCDQGRCQSRLRSTLATPLRQVDPGGQRVEVVARDSTGGTPAETLPATPDSKLERAALRILGSERRSGALAQALGSVRLTTVQVGDLNARGRRLGATMLVDLAQPRRDLWATVPAYVSVEGDSGVPYTPQHARMHVAVLRDALIDIDVGRRRVIAFEPGPRSRSLSWSPSLAMAPTSETSED